MTGRITEIWRHPIKAHGFEALDSTEIRKGETLPWDRIWAVTHEGSKLNGNAWAPCMNFSRGAKAPHLMAISTTLDEATSTVTLTHPTQGAVTFQPDEQADVARFLDWIAPLMPDGRAASTGIIRATGQGMTDSSSASISLGNLATLRVLEQHLGQALDTRRFRINLWVEGLAPMEELEWLDKPVRLGEIQARARDHAITRCASTMANPETGKRDAETLTAMNDIWGHQDLGITLITENSGTLSVGDSVAQE